MMRKSRRSKLDVSTGPFSGSGAVVAILLLLLVQTDLFALSPSKMITQYSHQSWTARQGLPQSSVRALLQTRDGYIWMGTGAGLVRFDGVRFTVFDKTNTPGLRDDDIRALAEDRHGNLWIGTYGGGLTRMRGSESAFFGKESGLRSEMIRSLFVDRSGTLWIATFGGGLSRYQAGRFVTLTKADGLADDQVKGIAEEPSGALWVGSYNGGVSRMSNGKIKTYTTADGLPSMIVFDILVSRSGAVWFATYGGGIARLENERFTVLSKAEGLADDRTLSLEEDRDGNLWIGLYGKGIQRLTKGTFDHFTTDHGLTGTLVFDLMEDQEGNLWIATFNGGLNQLRDGKFTAFTTSEGLSGNTVFSVSPAANGGVWVTIEGSGINRITNGKVDRVYTTKDGLSSDNAVTVLEDRRGDVWIGTFDGNLHRLQNEKLLTYTKADGLGADAVWSLYEDPDGVIWMGTRGGGVSWYDGKTFSTLTEATGLAGDNVRAILRDKSGATWIGTDTGISRMIGKRLEKITKSNGLPSDAIIAFHEDTDGVMWIGTRGGGLARWDKGKIFNYSRRNGLPDDAIFRILEDESGYLWMSTLRGVFRIPRKELNEFAAGDRQAYTGTLYDESDGMEDSQCSGGAQPAGAKAADGRLWFPTVKGVVVVNPAGTSRDSVPPPVYIEGLVVDRVVYPLGSTALPAGSRNVEIRYTAPSFRAPEKVRFAYRLEGFDQDWTDAGSRRAAYYTALPPGDYKFQVQAFNSDNVASQRPATTSFEIGRLFYQTAWFYLLAAALLLLFTYLIIRGRLKVIRAEAQARSAELERSLIEAQKMEALGQMASGIAHDFNNTMMTALPWADILAAKYEREPLVQKASQHIREAVLRASGVTRQLLDFAQPKRPEKSAVDLVALLRDHLRLIRPSISPEIEIDLNARGSDLIVHADPAQLQQIVLNLSLNAKDAMPRGGKLQFEVRRINRREIDEWGIDLPDAVVLCVSDSGTGIDENNRLRVFDPFFTTKELGRASGLGLAVVHRIVEEHGGKIILAPQQPGGTTFYIVLPAFYPGSDAAAQAPAVEGRSSGKLERLQIVMIDDECDLAEGVKMLLEMEGAAVTLYPSGIAALAAIDFGLRPDLVILDLGMPEMTGDEVHAELRRRMPRLPIIISSGYGDRARLDPLLADGYTRFKQKPYPFEELEEEIVKSLQFASR